jgi:hypothetical protein
MKKLVIIICLVAALIAGLVGGTTLAASKPPTVPVVGPAIMMDGGSGNLTITYIPESFPQFVSPQYNQMRHISVTLYANPSLTTPLDTICVRAYWKDSEGARSAKVVVLELTSCELHGRTIEFDATRWDIVGNDADDSGDFEAFFNYTTTYPNLNNQNQQ